MTTSICFLLVLQLTPPAAELTGDQIMERVQERDRARAARLEQYQVIRQYVVENKRWNKHAQMEVKLVFHHPDEKSFEVISQNGSGFIRKRVLKRLMETEEQGIRGDSRKNSAIHSTNYSFTVVGDEMVRERSCYAVEAKPKRKDKLLFVGRVYVDKEDFAIARIEGSPAKKPSFWTTRIEFVREYQKVGDFWLPMNDDSVTHVRIFGPTVLTVRYGSYQVTSREEASE